MRKLSASGARVARLDEDLLGQYDELDRPGKPRFIQQLVERLLVSVPVRLASIKAAIAKQDADQICHEAHALKSIVGNVGALSLFEICNTLEKQGQIKLLGNAEATYREMSAEYVAVAEELRKRYL